MKSNTRIHSILIYLIITTVLSACSRSSELLQEVSSSPTAVPYHPEDIVYVLQADFDTAADLNYFHLVGNEGKPIDSPESYLENGTLLMSPENIMFMDLSPTYKKGLAVHVRWKVNGEECHGLRFIPAYDINLHPEYAEQYGQGYEFGSCSYDALEINSIEEPIDGFEKKSMGMVILENDTWFDAILWMEDSSPARLNVFAWNTDNDEIYTAATTRLPQYDELQDFTFNISSFGLDITVDSYKVISSGIESYLWFNAPAYSRHYNDVMNLFDYDFTADTGTPPENGSTQATEAGSVTDSQESIEERTEQSVEEPSNPPNQDIVFDLLSGLLQPEDLPQDPALTATREDAYDSLDDLRLTRTLLQEPSGGSGGLEITSEVAVYRSTFRNLNDLMQTVGFDISNENLRTDAPEAGEFSFSFFRSPFERYLASQGNISVDIYCRNILTGTDPLCTPENLSALAALMLDRMPAVDTPPLLEFDIPEQSSDAWLEYFSMNEPLSMNIEWHTKESLPSMEIIMFHDDLQQTIYWVNYLDIVGAEAGPGTNQIRPGQQGDNENMPLGNYQLFVIVGDEIAYETSVARE